MTQPRPRAPRPVRHPVKVDALVHARLVAMADARVTSPEHLASLLLGAALDALEAQGLALQFTITALPAVPRVAPPHPPIRPEEPV